MKSRVLVFLLLLSGSLIVSGCGSKGPLYLPGKKPDAPRTTP